MDTSETMGVNVINNLSNISQLKLELNFEKVVNNESYVVCGESLDCSESLSERHEH